MLIDRHGSNQGRNDQSILGPAPPAHQGGGGGGYGGGYNQRQGGYGQGRNQSSQLLDFIDQGGVSQRS